MTHILPSGKPNHDGDSKTMGNVYLSIKNMINWNLTLQLCPKGSFVTISSPDLNVYVASGVNVDVICTDHVSPSLLYSHVLFPVFIFSTMSSGIPYDNNQIINVQDCNVLFGFINTKCRLTRRVLLVDQELLTLPEHLSSPPVFSGVHVTRSLVCMFCRSLFVLLAIVLSVLLRYTVSSNSSTTMRFVRLYLGVDILHLHVLRVEVYTATCY